MAFLFKCKHGDQCDRCSQCESEKGVHNAIKELRATGLETINVNDAIGIIEGCIKANDEKNEKRDRRESDRRHKEDMERTIAALMPDEEDNET